MDNIDSATNNKITQSEQQQTVIARQEQFLQSIYDNVREAIFVVDIEADGTFRYQGFNAAAINQMGIDDGVNKTPAQIFAPEVASAIVHRGSDRCQIAISVRELDDYYEFSVSDNGKGIDPKYHARIFTIFQTLEAKDRRENTGIGLSIVKKAVESQGGEISLVSALKSGTTFKFTWRKLKAENN